VKLLADLNAHAALVVKITLWMLGAALLLGGSLLGAVVAAAAAVPSAYIMWLGAQEETQRTYAWGVVLLLVSLLLAVVLFLRWIF
jgi:hypothetical protein